MFHRSVRDVIAQRHQLPNRHVLSASSWPRVIQLAIFSWQYVARIRVITTVDSMGTASLTHVYLRKLVWVIVWGGYRYQTESNESWLWNACKIINLYWPSYWGLLSTVILVLHASLSHSMVRFAYLHSDVSAHTTRHTCIDNSANDQIKDNNNI